MIWAVIKLQKEGFHYWKDAPEKVAFLRNKHRHTFHITVWVEQQHDERDVEYIMFKHWLEENIPNFDGPQSCESMAIIIKVKCENYFNNTRKIKVQVMEDDENGALIE